MQLVTPQRRSGMKDKRLPWVAAAFVVAVSASMWWGLRDSQAGAYPNGPEDKTLFVCTKDGTSFEMTPRELYIASRDAGNVPLGNAPCPTCHKPTGVAGVRVNGKVVPAGTAGAIQATIQSKK